MNFFQFMNQNLGGAHDCCMGFVGPQAAKKPAPVYTSGSGFAKRPVVPVSTAKRSYTPTKSVVVRQPTTAMPPVRRRSDVDVFIPTYDDTRAYLYGENFRAGQRRDDVVSIAAQLSQEITDRQGREAGDGIAFDVEADARGRDAITRAVDSPDGTGIPAAEKIQPAQRDNLLPLAVAGLLAYLFI